MNRNWTFALLGTALALVIAVGASTFFIRPIAAAQAIEAQTTQTGAYHGGGGRWGGSNYNVLLADELGITVEELETAQAAATDRAIDQAVADGDLTQEQADQMKAERALQASIDHEAIVAEALGLSVADYQAARAEGQSIADIIEAQGLDAQTVFDAIQAAYTAAVQQAVDDGIITQAQADEILSRRGGFGFGGRGGFGGPFGGHGGRGHFRSAPNADTDATQPTTGL